MSDSNTSRVQRDSLRISSVERPGWHVAPGKVPEQGEWICCVEGPAEVLRVLGKTSDGGRLLELRCESRPQPFFASSSNIMFRTDDRDQPMPHRSPPPPLAHFLELYAARRFWASHEALEEEWFRTGSNFYQGLILYASGWVHWERRNAHGLRAQSIKALQRLDGYPPAYMGLDVDALRVHCIDLRDLLWPGFDAWHDVAPTLLVFNPDRVLGTEPELSG